MNMLSKITRVMGCEMDDPEENKAIVRRYLEEIANRRNFAALDNFFSEEVVFNDARNFATDHPAFMLAIQNAFSDHHLTIEDQIVEGDKVVTRVTFRGTPKEPLSGICPSVKQLEWTGIAIDRIADGKVVEMWHVQNPPRR